MCESNEFGIGGECVSGSSEGLIRMLWKRNSPEITCWYFDATKHREVIVYDVDRCVIECGDTPHSTKLRNQQERCVKCVVEEYV